MIKLNTFISIIFIFMILLQSSCSMPKKRFEKSEFDGSLPSTYVWKKGKQYVAFVKTIPLTGRNINMTIHPVNISPDTIYNSFSKLKYKVKGSNKKKKLFSDGNLELLAEKIPEALKQAKRNQDILFEIYRFRKKWWILPTTIDTTAGYLFVEPGKINIVFEKVNEDYQGYDYDEPRVVVGDASEGVYGSRFKVSKGWVILTSQSWN